MSGSPLILPLCRLFSRIAPVAAVMFALFIADIFASGYLEPKLLFRALPGTSQAISGELAYPAYNLANLSYVVSPDRVQVFFTATQGKLWHGRLQVGRDTPPGEYLLQVFVGRTPPRDALPRYRIQIFADKAHLDASYMSLTRRYMGVNPLWLALATFVLVISGLAGSYLLSSYREQQLAGQDIVPIAKMARTKKGWEIHFALGLHQGIRPQDTLLLLDAGFAPVGRIIVDKVESDHSSALVPFNRTIAPDYWLAKAQE